MSLSHVECTLVIDAVKVPAAALARGVTFSVQWSYGAEIGETAASSPASDEVIFDHPVSFPVDLAVAAKLLQLSVLRHQQHIDVSGGGEVIGILFIDLNAHIPKPPQLSSRQRATLAMSRCPYQPSVMVRLMVETTVQPSAALGASSPWTASTPHQHVVASGRGTSLPAARRSVSLTRPDEAEEVERLRGTLSTLSAANKNLRDENALLKVAAQKAREEPGYTYQALRDSGSGSGQHHSSPPNGSVGGGARKFRDVNDPNAIDVMKAEIAVLQRGLHAAKEQIREDRRIEEDLRQEIDSLVKTNRFSLEEVQRLEREVESSRASRNIAAESQSSAQSVRNQLLELQDRFRDLSNNLAATRRDLDVSRTSCDELEHMLKLEIEKRKKLESDCAMQVQSATAEADRAKAALQVGQQELSGLHRYCTELGERWKAVVGVVESQKHSIERKNERILELRSLLRGQQLQQRLADQ